MPSQTSTIISNGAACAAPLSTRSSLAHNGAAALHTAMVSSAIPNSTPRKNGVSAHFPPLSTTMKHASPKLVKAALRNGLTSSGPRLTNGHHKPPPCPTPPGGELCLREPHDLPPPKTEASPSSVGSSPTTKHPHHARLVRPSVATAYPGTRLSQLSARFQGLERRLLTLQGRVRGAQAQTVQGHAGVQVTAFQEAGEGEQGTPVGEGRRRESSSGGPGRPWQRCFSGGLMESYRGWCVSEAMECSHPIQVDGAADSLPPAGREAFQLGSNSSDSLEGFHWQNSAELGSTGLLRINSTATDTSVFPNEALAEASPLTSVSSLSLLEEEAPRGAAIATCISQQLESLEGLLDEELTDSSSDEEDGADSTRFQEILRRWERARSHVGTRWSWLEHRIAALSRQLCQVDSTLQAQPERESFVSAGPEPLSCMCTLTGGAFPAAGVGRGVCAATPSSGPTRTGSNGHLPCPHFPQLLLPENMLNTKLQVKDLLASSLLGRGFSVVLDESVASAARTRPLEKRAKRKLVRLPRERGRGRKVVPPAPDGSLHPTLSLPEDLPSRVWLDSAVKQIGAEHSYAALSSRRRRTAPLAMMSSAQLFKSPSTSLDTPSSSGSSGSSSVRKKTLTPHRLMRDGSPCFPLPSTPTLTPQPPRRKKLLPSTPSYDIDNIVIPYSMAASTRLEKLEYKEILTPSWRVVEEESGVNGQCRDQEGGGGGQPSSEALEDEDCSEEAFLCRHGNYEVREKKRFLNFVSGAQRKRQRPGSMSDNSPLEGPGLGAGPLVGEGRPPLPLLSPSSVDGHRSSSPVLLLAWLPRKFPLAELDMDALVHPVPPPPIRLPPPSSHSPSPLAATRSCTPTDSRLPPRTPTPSLSACSSLVTPLSTPPSTPLAESPLLSPTEWMVLSCIQPAPARAVPMETNDSHIVLKLGKKS